jgi:hypothetical protein
VRHDLASVVDFLRLEDFDDRKLAVFPRRTIDAAFAAWAGFAFLAACAFAPRLTLRASLTLRTTRASGSNQPDLTALTFVTFFALVAFLAVCSDFAI